VAEPAKIAAACALILDASFNHCGRGFWAFLTLRERARSPPYVIGSTRSTGPLNHYGGGGGGGGVRLLQKDGSCVGYHCWWNDLGPPSFNRPTPAVRPIPAGGARHWIAAGVDGFWRLDVPE